MVVHCKKQECDVYIGRKEAGMHYGNPFSHKQGTNASVIVKSREEAVRLFREWLLGNEYNSLEQARRSWILKNLKELKGKILGCWCAPLSCHGDVLSELSNKQ